MTRIMVCGSKDESDIEMLADAGVDAIGLITEVSQDISCNLSREQARKLSLFIPPMTTSVLIITEERIEEICRLADYVRPNVVQIHGFNPPEDLFYLKEKLGVKMIKTLHLDGESIIDGDNQPEIIRSYLDAGVDAILLDTYSNGKVGSTGRTSDLKTASCIRDMIQPKPFIIAGGLNAGNVADVIKGVKPFAVDVYSGVNRQGSLDPQKVREFVEAVKQSHSQSRYSE